MFNNGKFYNRVDFGKNFKSSDFFNIRITKNGWWKLMNDNLNIIVYGAGAIGSSIGGWIFANYPNIYLKARGDHAKAMKEKGLKLYMKDKEKDGI